MGSTGIFVPRNTPLLQVLEQTDGIRAENIVAKNSVGGVTYLAYRITDGRVIGLVCLVNRRKDEVIVKTMDEQMGPYYCDASARVLAALSPTDNEYALKWRASCQARLAAKAVLPKFKVGQLVKFTHAVKFTGGFTKEAGDPAVVVKLTAKYVIVESGSTGRLRVPRSRLAPNDA